MVEADLLLIDWEWGLFHATVNRCNGLWWVHMATSRDWRGISGLDTGVSCLVVRVLTRHTAETSGARHHEPSSKQDSRSPDWRTALLTGKVAIVDDIAPLGALGCHCCRKPAAQWTILPLGTLHRAVLYAGCRRCIIMGFFFGLCRHEYYVAMKICM